jgi:hypothetical protein
MCSESTVALGQPSETKPTRGTDVILHLRDDSKDYLDTYTLRTIVWSPDSKHLVAYRTRPGYLREVHYVESSPSDQIQPKSSTMVYPKPGDTLDVAQPSLFELDTKKEIQVENSLFPNAYDITLPVWWKDSRGFTFEYNQRGHQLYRVIEVDAQTGRARTLITEESKAFVDYRPLAENRTDTGKKFRHDLDDPAPEQIERAEAKLFELATTGQAEGGFQPFTTALTSAITLAQAAFKRDGKTVGVASGFVDLDKKLGGLHPSDLIILAGRPSMGKTSLATNLAFNAAKAYRAVPGPDGRPVALYRGAVS